MEKWMKSNHLLMSPWIRWWWMMIPGVCSLPLGLASNFPTSSSTRDGFWWLGKEPNWEIKFSPWLPKCFELHKYTSVRMPENRRLILFRLPDWVILRSSCLQNAVQCCMEVHDSKLVFFFLLQFLRLKVVYIPWTTI